MMFKNPALQRFFDRAKKNEKEYKWLRAAESYNEAQDFMLKHRNFLRTGETQERIGFCLQRAAMQAKTREELMERMQDAAAAYNKAVQSYSRLESKQGEARQLRCEATVKYICHWLTANPDEKRKLLNDCLELEGKSLLGFLEAGDALEYAKTYTCLPLVFFYRVFLESDRSVLRNILEKGLQWGKKAVTRLPKNHDLVAGASLTMATCLIDAGFYMISKSEKIDEYRLQAADYLKTAVEISEKNEDAYSLGLAHLWLGINSGGEEATGHHEKALEYGRQTRDNFLMANSLDYLAYDTYWKARAREVETPETRKQLTEKALQFYEDAQKHYSIMSFMSPRGGLLGPPSGWAEHYYHMALWEPNPKRRLGFLKKSEKLGKDALILAENSGMPLVVAQALHVLSKTLQARAHMELDGLKKSKHLEKALEHREKTIRIQEKLTPFFYWNLGVMLNYLAGIKAELADLESNREKRTRLLKEAVKSLNKCLRLCSKVMPDFERKGEITLFAGLRDYQDTFATLLERLYGLTKKPENLRMAINALREAIRSAGKLSLFTLMAESYWKIAKAEDILEEHLEAAEDFRHASQNYTEAAKKIPQLNDFYKDHAQYMQAWNEIEKAKYSHAQKKYGRAKKHYEKASELHEATKKWGYLSSNYLAWARLEEAEDLSRAEKTRGAKVLFQNAAGLFLEAKCTLRITARRIEDVDERDLVRRLIRALEIRETYCLGRAALEDAKLLSRQGSDVASSKKYSLAAKRFQEVLSAIERESSFSKATIAKDRHELMPIICLSKAWQKMKEAEAEASPKMYLEAAKLFRRAKEYSVDERSKLLALGHNRFCKALEAGTRFESSRDPSFYLDATQHLQSAADYYIRAGFQIASEYALAMQRLFDAYIYVDSAMRETDPERKARYYMVAEKVLKTATRSFLKAKHSAKSKQVERLLKKVKEEKELAASLSEILNAPTITSSTASFVTPTPTEESAVGLEKFEITNIQVKLIVPAKETPVGGNFHLELHIANVGKKAVLLDKIREIVFPGLELIAMPSYCYVEKTDLNMRGRRLDPLKTEVVDLVLQGSRKGTFKVRPEIVYVDEGGCQMISQLEPVTIAVLRTVLPNRVTTGHERLDSLLLGGIPENYAVILTSPSCDERDLLVRRFLKAGIDEGQTTFFVTTKAFRFADLIEEQQPNFYVLICNPEVDQIVTNRPNVLAFRGVENLTEINIALTRALRGSIVSANTPRRFCNEIVSDVLLQHQALKTRKWLSGLLAELRSNNFTVLAVMDVGMHLEQESRAVLDLFDGEISISDKGNVRFVRVRRLAKEEYLDSELPVDEQRPAATR